MAFVRSIAFLSTTSLLRWRKIIKNTVRLYWLRQHNFYYCWFFTSFAVLFSVPPRSDCRSLEEARSVLRAVRLWRPAAGGPALLWPARPSAAAPNEPLSAPEPLTPAPATPGTPQSCLRDIIHWCEDLASKILHTLHLKGSYDAISSFPLSLECNKLFVHR